MKKYVVLAMFLVFIIMLCTGCNKQIIDFGYTYDYAILSLPNGDIVEGKIDKWKDYEGDQLQIFIDGVGYLAHASDVVLIVID